MDTLLNRLGARARSFALKSGASTEAAVTRALDELAVDQPLGSEAVLSGQVHASLSGYGALEPFMQDPEVEELWMNEPNILFVHKRGRVERLEIQLDADQQSVAIDRMLRSIGRRVDRSVPFVDSPLQDGSRLHVVIPDVTRNHMSFNLRRFTANRSTLESLIDAKVVSAEQADALRAALLNGETIFVSGATAAGKTTLLCSLLAALPETERIVSVEDTFEISITNPDWVAMQTRPASVEGVGEIDMRRLIREALRMRPSRLVVGEVRGAEALELLVSLNSGIPGLCTVHANSAEHALTKLLTLPLLGGSAVPLEFVKQVLGSTVGLVAHCEQDANGARHIAELKRVSLQSGELRFEDAS
jgi:pilus assembly protein CpaF